jgi:hypothetical protein
MGNYGHGKSLPKIRFGVCRTKSKQPYGRKAPFVQRDLRYGDLLHAVS